ncbi:MAG TPA: TadE/TadG family type IV pilus assembly protein [Telluria sp.]
MSARSATRRITRQRGVAAIEFAILVPVLLILLTAPLYVGRVLWHYTVVQKAAHDAARYLSTVPEAEMRSIALAPSAAALADSIIQAELADLNTGSGPPSVTVMCNGRACSGVTAWSTVSVYIETEMRDPFFGTGYGGVDGLVITADVQMKYIGTK